MPRCQRSTTALKDLWAQHLAGTYSCSSQHTQTSFSCRSSEVFPAPACTVKGSPTITRHTEIKKKKAITRHTELKRKKASAGAATTKFCREEMTGGADSPHQLFLGLLDVMGHAPHRSVCQGYQQQQTGTEGEKLPHEPTGGRGAFQVADTLPIPAVGPKEPKRAQQDPPEDASTQQAPVGPPPMKTEAAFLSPSRQTRAALLMLKSIQKPS
ncbi:hypothetical protein Anapl_00936 [Anas platyrhynchos]|uniref:Uncharacterized protein n=1 Tax=Anas platyrhynchos TaxID=8839 RepID=R0JYY2_ANAPL|nr:hypothetical protein Anapl_00936 [Anas platyrhynchos]